MMQSFGRVGWMSAGIVLLVLLVVGVSPTTHSQSPDAEVRVHLPLMQGFRPPPAPTRFGSELINSSANALALAEAGGVTWARQNHLSWAAVEPTPGARNWAALAGLEANLAARSAAGMTNLLIIGDTPTWARRDPTHICSAITPDALDDFATFMVELATRYNRPPYHVSHFELYNEPDVPANAVPTDSPFGCWGHEDDPYYGGTYYSEMLSTIYPRIKEHNGNVQIVVGGLLLACDYTHRYPDRRRCDSSKFLRGILRHGKGENFDMVAYHGYPLHSSNRVDWERQFAPWAHRGGAVFGKLSFIRDELAAYGVDVPILLTESALICYEGASCNNDQTLLRQDQAVYVVRLYSRAIANDLDGVLWYSFNDPGWRYAGLLDGQENPLPAYFAFKFMSSYLSRATYVATLGSGINAPEGYAFRAEGRDVHVYWSNDARTYTMPFPPQAMLYDKVGNLLPPPADGVLTIGFEPVYLFFPLP